jgi:hypothetical protein
MQECISTFVGRVPRSGPGKSQDNSRFIAAMVSPLVGPQRHRVTERPSMLCVCDEGDCFALDLGLALVSADLAG